MRLSLLPSPLWPVALLHLAAAGTMPGAGEPGPGSGFSFGFDFKLDLGDVQKALGGAMPSSLCGTYATVANYSAIGANPQMRGAWQNAAAADGHGDAASDGAAFGRLLDTCGRAVGQFAANDAINDRCGNLTEVAHDEAARNFSRGIVADRIVSGGPVPGLTVVDAADANAAGVVVLAPWRHLVGVAVLVSLGVGLL